MFKSISGIYRFLKALNFYQFCQNEDKDRQEDDFINVLFRIDLTSPRAFFPSLGTTLKYPFSLFALLLGFPCTL